MTGEVEVIVEDPAWGREGVDWAHLAGDLHARVLTHLKGARREGAVVLLADDARLTALNAQFRGKDGPTNVLSFPAPPGADSLGDIAIAHGVCAREAEAQEKTFTDHATHLILHGLLHLHGLDHEAGEAEAEEMETLERAILWEIGVADPYEARAGHV